MGNSARARSKDGQRQPRDGNGKKRSSRRKKREEFPDTEDLDVIPAAELEVTKNGMNLAELKTRPAAELVLNYPSLRSSTTFAASRRCSF